MENIRASTGICFFFCDAKDALFFVGQTSKDLVNKIELGFYTAYSSLLFMLGMKTVWS